MRRAFTALIVAAGLVAPTGVAALSIESGTLDQVVNDWSSSLSGRWRDLGENAPGERNLYLEAPTISPPPDAQGLVNPLGGTGAFTFAYSALTGVASMSLNGVSISVDYSTSALKPTGFNDLLFKLRTPNTSATLELSGLTLNGSAITPGAISNSVGGETFWFVRDAIVGDSFELSGVFTGTGLTTSNEANRFEIQAGNLNAIPLPAAAWMLLGAIGGLGAMGWRKRRTA